MSSGVQVNQNCLEQFQALKLGKKIRFIIYELSADNTEIVVAKTSDSSNYDDFVAELPAGECRYAIYDFEYQKGDEGKRNKIVFVTWYVAQKLTIRSPDESKVKQKMLYASSKDALRKALVGIAAEIQGTDLSEVSYDAVLEKVTRGTF
ncbi:cofilin [Malassezia psittaci]|uniref:Cofilin n=1 Tax=Malassezia psittaci TaxID=1821823 RepID=A0AAF0JE15_9BASI|nr:cofilin [Malassezia psittaci]